MEGFFGSAVQLAALATMGAELAASGVRIVFIHTLNPYGFAWSRHVNEDNIDLNRNFVLEGEQYAGCPHGYARLDSLLNPPRPPRWQDAVPLRALPVILREGLPALTQAVVGGQYDFPKGLFFGGRAQAPTVRILADHLPQWIGDCERVLHLDLHTGLGKWATYQLLADDLTPSDWWSRAQPTLSGHRIILPQSASGSYRIRGGLGHWTAARFAGRNYQLSYTEFGSYHPIRVLHGLRAENQTHHWGRSQDPSTVRAKRRLRELFCPGDAGWRKQSLAQALALLDAAHRLLGARDDAV